MIKRPNNTVVIEIFEDDYKQNTVYRPWVGNNPTATTKVSNTASATIEESPHEGVVIRESIAWYK
jgi:hypothetical protein